MSGSQKNRSHTGLLLKNHFLLKSRKPCVSLFECLFSGIFCCLLVFGWSRSDDTSHGEMIYAENDFYNITGSMCLSNCSVLSPDQWCYRPADRMPKLPAGTLEYCSDELSLLCGCNSPEMYYPWGGHAIPICPVVKGIPKPEAPVDPTPMDPSLSPQEKDIYEKLIDYAEVITMMLRPTSIPSIDSLLSLKGLGYSPPYNSLEYRGVLGFVPSSNTKLNCTDMQHLSGGYFENYVRQNILQREGITPPWPRPDQEYPGCPRVWKDEETFVKSMESEWREIWALVLIHEIDWDKKHFDLTIRMQSGALPWTFSSYDLFHTQGPWPWEQYVTSGFVSLQHFLFTYFKERPPNETWIHHENHSHHWFNLERDLSSDTVIMPLASPAYKSNDFLDQSASMFPLIMCISFIFFIAALCAAVVDEKESKVKQSQLIMGLSLNSYYLSLLILVLVMSFIGSAVSTAILGATIFVNTPIPLLFLVIFLYAVSIGGLALLCSSFLSKTRLAAVVAPVALLIFVVPKYTLPSNLSMSTRHLLSLLSGCAFSETLTTILTYEQGFITLRWSDLFVDEFSIALGLMFLVVDSVLYLLLAWYLDQVIPSQWGRSKPMLFFLPKILSSHNKKRCTNPEISETALEPGAYIGDDGSGSETSIEPPSTSQCVKINNIVKQYPGLPVPAVNGIDLTLKEGEITVLLGHNGAGKTTLIDCLIGMQIPTSGDALIYGKSISRDNSSVRKLIGYCPQHNILWPKLTCMEHILHFSLLKHPCKATAIKQAESMLGMVGLTEKRDTQTGKLSGGQKRKLSIILAFCGDAKFVVLDEPTAGVDVKSRRAIWDLLKNKELTQNRVVLLTTHYMDEADHLGMKVAIMSHGKLYCHGTPLYLRNNFGGYILTVTTTEENNSQELLETVQGCADLSSRILSEAASELRIHLPTQSVSKDVCFPPLFSKLDSLITSNVIRGYGISLTTLEDVFIKIAEEGDVDLNSRMDLIPTLSFVDKVKNKFSFFFKKKTIVVKQQQSESVNLINDDYVESPSDDDNENNENNDSGVSEPAIQVIESDRESVIESIEDSMQTIVNTENQQCDINNNSLSEALIDQTSVVDGHNDITVDVVDDDVVVEEEKKVRSKFIRYPRQFYATFMKRCHFARRDHKTLIFQLLLPMVFLGVTLLIESIGAPAAPDIIMDSDLYKGTKMYVNDEEWKILMEETQPGFEIINCNTSCKTSIEMSNYILTHDSKDTSVGFVFDDHLESVEHQNGVTPSKPYVSILHNGKKLHSLPVGVAAYQNSLLRNITGTDSYIKLHNHPFSSHHIQKTYNKVKNVLTAVFVTTPFLLTPAHFCAFIVREREIKALHIQRVSGLSMPVYWLANFAFDVLLQIVTCGVAVGIFYAAGSFYVHGNVIAVLVTLLSTYSAAIVPFSYVTTLRVKTGSFAQSLVMSLNFGFGFVLLILSSVLDALPNTKSLNRSLRHVYQIHPAFCLGHGLLKIATRYERFHPTSRAFKSYYVGNDIMMLSISGPTALLLLLVFSAIGWDRTVSFFKRPFKFISKCCVKISRNRSSSCISQTSVYTQLDNDGGDTTSEEPVRSNFHSAVEAEHQDILNNPNRLSDRVRVVDLSKRYSGTKKHAVKDVTFGVKKGEVFAILGGNGAGKTSTLSMITGDFAPTSGSVHVNGTFGLCPQHDCCIENLSVEEHLQLYARIRDEKLVSIEEKIKVMGLQKFRKKLFKNLSGGNKRKLGVSVAMMGDSDILVLDEPSAGIDPVARKSLWSALTSEVGNIQRSIILTTHHLEEIEGLSGKNHRITVLHGGQMLCLGTLQQLKSDLGLNYELSATVNDADRLPDVEEFLKESFPGTVLHEVIRGSVKFLIPKEATASVGDVFLKLENSDLRKKSIITDYSVSDTSLDTIILQLTENATDGLGDGDDLEARLAE